MDAEERVRLTIGCPVPGCCPGTPEKKRWKWKHSGMAVYVNQDGFLTDPSGTSIKQHLLETTFICNRSQADKKAKPTIG